MVLDSVGKHEKAILHMNLSSKWSHFINLASLVWMLQAASSLIATSDTQMYTCIKYDTAFEGSVWVMGGSCAT